MDNQKSHLLLIGFSIFGIFFFWQASSASLQLPSNSQILPDGSITANGRQLAPPGYIKILPTVFSEGQSKNIYLCNNLTLAPAGECGSAGGVSVSAVTGNEAEADKTSNANENGKPLSLVCDENSKAFGSVCIPSVSGLSNASIPTILLNLFYWLMGLFTTLTVLTFAISGVQYFMASGDEKMAENAKKNAINSCIGIVIGLSGFIIVKAIAAALSGGTYFF